MKVMQCVSENLRRLRKNREMTQEELAMKSGLSLPAIQLIESGKRWPELKTIEVIASALRIESSWLFEDFHE